MFIIGLSVLMILLDPLYPSPKCQRDKKGQENYVPRVHWGTTGGQK